MGCLGTVDGTFIDVEVYSSGRSCVLSAKFRNQNVLMTSEAFVHYYERHRRAFKLPTGDEDPERQEEEYSRCEIHRMVAGIVWK